MHPDVFAAAALEKTTADLSKVHWVQDRVLTKGIEHWAKKHLTALKLPVASTGSNIPV